MRDSGKVVPTVDASGGPPELREAMEAANKFALYCGHAVNTSAADEIRSTFMFAVMHCYQRGPEWTAKVLMGAPWASARYGDPEAHAAVELLAASVANDVTAAQRRSEQ